MMGRLPLLKLSPKAKETIELLDVGQNEHGFDPFGMQPEFLRFMLPIVEFLHDVYFRVEVDGIEHVPDRGRVLLIANHAGQLPFDAMMIGTTLLLQKRPPRAVRSMVERWVSELPVLSWVFPRIGQVLGTRANARALLEGGASLLVFPEGVRGISKTYDKAYQLQPFGKGFMRLALETRTPIVPVSVVGSEEQLPAIANIKPLAEFLGAPSFPITPTWPLLGPLGFMPLPVKYHIRFGEPMLFEGDPDDEDRIIAVMVDEVRRALDALLAEGLARRTGYFF
ncbi:MAG: lysophospholipid acyltransferase family protein [Myxococcota bacterium]